MKQICLVLIFLLLLDFTEGACNNNHFKENQKDVFVFRTKTETGMREKTLQNGSYYDIKAKIKLENWDGCLFQISVEIIDANEMNIDYPGLIYELDSYDMGKYFYTRKTLFEMENGLVTKIYSDEVMGKTGNKDLVNFQRGLIGLLQIQTDRITVKSKSEDDVTGRCKVSYKEEIDEKGRTILTKERELNNCEFRSSSKSNVFSKKAPEIFDSSSRCKYTIANDDSGLESIECEELHFLLPFSNQEKTEGRYVHTKIDLKREASSDVSKTKPSTSGLSTTKIFYNHLKYKTPTGSLFQLSYQAEKRIKKLASDRYIRESHFDSAKTFFETIKILRKLGKTEIDKLFGKPTDEGKRRILRDMLSSCGTKICIDKFIDVFKIKRSRYYQLPPHTANSLAFNADPQKTISSLWRVASKTKETSGLLTLTTLLSRGCMEDVLCRQGKRLGSVFFNVLKYPVRNINNLMRKLKKNSDFREVDYNRFVIVMKAIKNVNFVLKNRKARRTLRKIFKFISSRFLKLSVAAIEALDGILTSEIRETMLKIFENSRENILKRVAAFHVLSKDPNETIIKKAVGIVNDEEENVQLRLFLYSFIKTQTKFDNKYAKVLEISPLKSVKHSERKTSYYMVSTVSSDHFKGTVREWAIYEEGENLPIRSSYALQADVFGGTVDLFEINIEGDSKTPYGLAFFKLFGHTIDVLATQDLLNSGGSIFNLQDPISSLATITQGLLKKIKKQMVLFEGYHSIPTILGSRINVEANIIADITMDMKGSFGLPSFFSKTSGAIFKVDATIHPSATILASKQLSISAPRLTKIATKIDTTMYFSKKLSGKFFYSASKTDIKYYVDKDRDLISKFSTTITNIMKRKTSQMKLRGKKEKSCTNDVWKTSELFGLDMCVESQYAFPNKSLSYNIMTSPISVTLHASLENSNITSYHYTEDVSKSNKAKLSAVGSVPEKYHEFEMTYKLEKNEQSKIVKTISSLATSDARPKALVNTRSEMETYENLQTLSSGTDSFQYKDINVSTNWTMVTTQNCFLYNNEVNYDKETEYKEQIFISPPYINFSIFLDKSRRNYFFQTKPITDEKGSKCDVISSLKTSSQSFLENVANIIAWVTAY